MLRRRVAQLEQAQTRHQRAEESLKREHILLRTVIDNLPSAIYVKDLHSRKTLANRAEIALMGLPTEAEALGKSDWDIYPTAVAEQFIADDQRVFNTGKPVLDREEIVVAAHGKKQWLSTSKLPLRNEHGKIIGLVGIGHDITARKNAEADVAKNREHLEELVAARTAELESKNAQLETEISERKRVESALRKSEEKFSKMFHACPIAMCFVSLKDRRFIEINQAYEEATGYTRAEVIGRTPMDFTLWTEPKKLEWVFHQVMTTGSYRDFEGVFRAKSGELKIGLLSAEIIEFGGERCMLTAAKDITERKHAEAQLRNLSQQLLRSQDAERRRIALDLHDSTAQQLVGLLLNLKALKNQTQTANAQAAALLDDCLAITKHSIAEIRTLSFLLHPPQLSHFGLLGAIRDFAAEFGRRSGIQVTLDLPQKTRGLTTEYEETLFRILQEALTNIHRHSGSATATIKLVRKAREIRLLVQDAGCGITKKVLNGLQSEASHYGVGISGMSERLKFFAGRLELKSSKRGTTVTAILPLNKSR